MSAEPSAVSIPFPSIKLGEAVLVGRLQRIRKIGDKYLHLLILPSNDNYTSPQTVEVTAESRLGEVESEIRVKVRLGGFRRSYRATDKETGEIRTVQTAENKFYAMV